MTAFTIHKLHAPRPLSGPGPLWLRSLLLGLLAGLTLVIIVLAPATRNQMNASKVEGDSETVNVLNPAYGSRDPYGYGPRAGADQGDPGGAADQESLITKEPGDPTAKAVN